MVNKQDGMTEKISEVLLTEKPDYVVVYRDTPAREKCPHDTNRPGRASLRSHIILNFL
jgi:hypothetical protein